MSSHICDNITMSGIFVFCNMRSISGKKNTLVCVLCYRRHTNIIFWFLWRCIFLSWKWYVIQEDIYHTFWWGQCQGLLTRIRYKNWGPSLMFNIYVCLMTRTSHVTPLWFLTNKSLSLFLKAVYLAEKQQVPML